MSDFTHVYFVCFQKLYKGKNCMVVKYGDSRGDTNTKLRYPRCYVKEIRLHRNSSRRSLGKEIQHKKLDKMVKNGSAIQIDTTEKYIVTTETCKSLLNNWEINTQKGFISEKEINNVISQFSMF